MLTLVPLALVLLAKILPDLFDNLVAFALLCVLFTDWTTSFALPTLFVALTLLTETSATVLFARSVIFVALPILFVALVKFIPEELR